MNLQRKLWNSFELAYFFLVRTASLFTLQKIGCAIYKTHYNWEVLVRSASLIVKVIAYSFCWTERKRKYDSQWQMTCSKWKWTSIATVPDLCPTTVKILTYLISRYQLPLIMKKGNIYFHGPIMKADSRFSSDNPYEAPIIINCWNCVVGGQIFLESD